MKALSVRQPHASRIASGRKTIETRSKPTKYRGPLLICATQRPQLDGLPAGVSVCTVRLVDCRPMTPADAGAACVAFTPGLYSWILEDVAPTAQIPVKGQLGLFNPTPDHLKALGLNRSHLADKLE